MYCTHPSFYRSKINFPIYWAGMGRSSFSSRATPWLFANMPLHIHGWDTPGRLQWVNFLCCSLKTEDRYLTSTLSQYTCFYNARRHWRPDCTPHLSTTKILKTYQKVIFNCLTLCRNPRARTFPTDVVKKEAWSWYIPTRSRYSQQKCHLHFLFFLLKKHTGIGAHQAETLNPLGEMRQNHCKKKGSSLYISRKTQAYAEFSFSDAKISTSEKAG